MQRLKGASRDSSAAASLNTNTADEVVPSLADCILNPLWKRFFKVQDEPQPISPAFYGDLCAPVSNTKLTLATLSPLESLE
ncbi:hypothetical protein P7K49_000158, partial [Saguinus oedipus]